jgi:prevent-host-death family protein
MCYRSPVSDTRRDHGSGRQASPVKAFPASSAKASAAKASPAKASAGQPGKTLSSRAESSHSIGVRELRQHASVYVDLAEKGQTVDITNRGRLVARLVPVRDVESPLERLIAAGIMQPAEDPGSLLDIEPAPPVPEGRPTASEILLKMREEERY